MVGGDHAVSCGSEVSVGIIWCETALTRLVDVNNIDGRKAIVGVPAHYICCGVTFAVVWWSVVTRWGTRCGAVCLLLALSGAYWKNILE
jgi:hypothetical protein